MQFPNAHSTKFVDDDGMVRELEISKIACLENPKCLSITCNFKDRCRLGATEKLAPSPSENVYKCIDIKSN